MIDLISNLFELGLICKKNPLHKHDCNFAFLIVFVFSFARVFCTNTSKRAHNNLSNLSMKTSKRQDTRADTGLHSMPRPKPGVCRYFSLFADVDDESEESEEEAYDASCDEFSEVEGANEKGNEDKDEEDDDKQAVETKKKKKNKKKKHKDDEEYEEHDEEEDDDEDMADDDASQFIDNKTYKKQPYNDLELADDGVQDSASDASHTSQDSLIAEIQEAARKSTTKTKKRKRLVQDSESE